MLYDEFHPIFFAILNKLHNHRRVISHFFHLHVQNGNQDYPDFPIFIPRPPIENLSSPPVVARARMCYNKLSVCNVKEARHAAV